MHTDGHESALQAVATEASMSGVPAMPEQSVRVRESQLPIRQRRGYGGALVAVLVGLVLVGIVQSLARNESARWHIVGQYLFDSRILHGAWVTIQLTALSMALGLVVAVMVALMRLSDTWALRQLAALFVWFFRSTPVLVLLIVTFNLALLYSVISIGIPGGVTLLSKPTNNLISPYWAAVIAFALNEAAYAAEILRTSILAVSKGQSEAGVALGMTTGRVYRRIVLPQAIRIAVPPLGNDTINMLKGTSLVAFISVFDLMYTAQSIYQINYEVFPLLIVVTLWYVAMVSVLSVVQSFLERRLRRRVRHQVANASLDAVAEAAR
jgi:polar amino acid transport system permease protein